MAHKDRNHDWDFRHQPNFLSLLIRRTGRLESSYYYWVWGMNFQYCSARWFGSWESRRRRSILPAEGKLNRQSERIVSDVFRFLSLSLSRGCCAAAAVGAPDSSIGTPFSTVLHVKSHLGKLFFSWPHKKKKKISRGTRQTCRTKPEENTKSST